MFRHYRRRSILCFVLITSQAFLYNAIFFTYALVLTRFYDVPSQHTGLYLLPFAIGNFLGPLAAGASLRHAGPARHDLRHVRGLGAAPAR